MMTLWMFVMTSVVTMATEAVKSGCPRYATFNAGLVPSTPNLLSRTPRIVSALGNLKDPDAVCLQELWLEKDMAEVLRSMGWKYPHHFSKLHHSNGNLREPTTFSNIWQKLIDFLCRPRDVPCGSHSATDIQTQVGGCATQQGCFQLPAAQQGLCVITRCGQVMAQFGPECVSCLSLFGSVDPIQGISVCTTHPFLQDNRVNSNGILFLSKEKPTRVSYQRFFDVEGQVIERGYVQAEFADGRKVICTHLSANLPVYFEFRLSFGTFANQSRAEIGILGQNFNIPSIIMMGDFNVGPAQSDFMNPEKNLTAELPDNYQLLTDFGFNSPYLTQDGRCTFCNANPLTRGFPNVAIDHVLTMQNGVFQAGAVKRFFDDPTVSPLSDHYGVEVELCET